MCKLKPGLHLLKLVSVLLYFFFLENKTESDHDPSSHPAAKPIFSMRSEVEVKRRKKIFLDALYFLLLSILFTACEGLVNEAEV